MSKLPEQLHIFKMKTKLILLLVLFSGCSNNNFCGLIYDYDTEKPLKNVYVKINKDITQTDSTGYFSINIKSNSSIEIFLNKEGYAPKKIYRGPDSSGKFSKRSLKENVIFLYNKESDFK